MPLNLITDSWIPVVRHGKPATICPHEIAADGVERLDWPRDDLNLACLELLIGLTFLADPPRSNSEWHDRYRNPDPDRLRTAYGPFGSHFELDGNGPRFLQDLDPFENQAKSSDISLPDMLFIDSAGTSTAEKNSDLMVKRNRYTNLELPLAAIALYTLQAFAPSGGAGNRTSMRGGGPMVTLMKPFDGGVCPLWRLVWCNVPEPEGDPLRMGAADRALPWLRPTRTSEKGQIVTQDMSHPAEAFFGMPRRIRLIFDGSVVTGVVQRPHGTNYEHWQHPLTPYYSNAAGGQRFPTHPKPGRLSYRNWLGLAFGNDSDKRFKAGTVGRFHQLANPPDAEVCVGGWAMSNMKPLDFNLHVYPTFPLDSDMDSRVSQLVEAANSVVGQLSRSLKSVMSLQGTAADTVKESFFADTEHDFVSSVQEITNGNGLDVEENWIRRLRQTALGLFDRHTISTLSDRNLSKIEAVVVARRNLHSFLTRKTGLRNMFPELPDTG